MDHWRLTPAVPALQRLRLEAIHGIEVTMSYTVSSRPAGLRVTLSLTTEVITGLISERCYLRPVMGDLPRPMRNSLQCHLSDT